MQCRMNTTRQHIVDRLIVGGLEKFLRDARENGQSFPSISLRLRDEYSIAVSSDSVRRWAIELGVHGEPEAASA